MKKRAICLAVIVIALLTCGILYFKPLSLSDIAGENDQVKVLYCELGVRNGEAYVDPVDYQDITPERICHFPAYLPCVFYPRGAILSGRVYNGGRHLLSTDRSGTAYHLSLHRI